MANDPSLLILAAGMGSRYGGLKQMDGFGPNGETIIDFSIYDAIEAGFKKVVFVIRKSFANEFISRMETKWSSKIHMDFVFQELDQLPVGFDCPASREKPWGTGHAVWVARESISGPFGVINADDFYGRDAMRTLYDYLSDGQGFVVVSYQLKNTLSTHGSVNRGICQVDEYGYLSKIVERKNIVLDSDGSIYYESEGRRENLDPDTKVSMNMWGFRKAYFQQAEIFFRSFLERDLSNPGAEFYIPDLIQYLIDNQSYQVKVLQSASNWIGVTYKEDKPAVELAFKELIDRGLYPF